MPGTTLLTIYVCLLTLIPAGLVFGPIGAAGTPATLWGIFLLILWLCSRLGGLGSRSHVSPVYLALGFLAVSVLLSWANGVSVGWVRPADVHQVTDGVYSLVPVSVSELQEKSQLAGIRGLLSVAGWLGVALILCDGLRTWRQLDRFVTTIVWLAAVIGLVGVIQFVTGTNLASYIRIPGLTINGEIGSLVRSGLNRVQATATHPIEYGVVLAALFPLALHQALYRVRRWYDYAPVALLSLAVPMSVSRSGILVLGASLLILFAGWSWNRRAWSLVLFPAVVVAMRATFPGLVGTIRSLFTSLLGDPSVSGRTSDYGQILGIYAGHPWLGRGASTFMPAYYRTLDNQFLMNLVELGAVGLVITLFLFIASTYAARYAKRHATSPEHQHLGLALSAGLVGIAMSYATFDAWGFPMAAGATFLLIGLSGAAWRMTRDDVRKLASANGDVGDG
ncbi:O-antigen ligase family protein [Nocardioides sp. InS609-2]|uniref:O-antigen ligase family protein n=1 Tax=Nocardioides sp. InS609-2 TaxID=2760705 RepID=UPI0020C0597B|nr:O-antigen ligase family protein [Nocardioides sp. InS609-2]